MPLRANLLLAVTALCCFATVFAFPMEGFTMDHQCHCLSTTNDYINSRWFQRIEILPAGSHCRKIEIIITLKDKKTVCVDPEANWVQKLINKVIQSRKRGQK
ncbi:alveolar macrophage chemotactic factor [Ictalurus punctatus]|uniref:Alveolar macrophage chemotactic factor n=1 Tax=Ictalurus punctatus TaxID=7998 RepID=A0A2D0PL50_ICTPU|nr:alveolar macrophage chemotactic factor [Ictalurus punctatus]